MSQLHTINVGETIRSFGLIARADGSPITAGTGNYFLKALTGDDAGKWWRDSDQTWQVAETENEMEPVADGAWLIVLTSSPFVHGTTYIEYAKESGDLHIPANHRLLKAMAAPGTNDGLATTGDVSVVISAAAAALQSVTEGGEITVYRGVRVEFELTLGSLVGRTGEKLFLTVKRDRTETDAQAMLQVTETTGAVIVDGEEYATAADASITVLDEITGETRIVLEHELSELLDVRDDYDYDVRMIDSAGKPVLVTQGVWNVRATVTRRNEV